MQPLDQQKAELRREMRKRRAQASAATSRAAEALSAQFFQELDLAHEEVIAGYWPIKSEADPRHILECLSRAGHETCLPVVMGEATPLLFRRWQPQEALVEADFGTFVPKDTADELLPDVLLVPLLAFDRQGYRLGYGGGFYDRTLEKLRPLGPRLAIGIAFSEQEVAAVPRGPYDAPLDYIVTEKEVISFGEKA